MVGCTHDVEHVGDRMLEADGREREHRPPDGEDLGCGVLRRDTLPPGEADELQTFIIFNTKSLVFDT